MPPPSTVCDLLELIRKSGLVETDRLEACSKQLRQPTTPAEAANLLVKQGVLTRFHVRQLLAGKTKGFVLGQYKLLEPIGKGGMGTVYLAEHIDMRRKVALKILPQEAARHKPTLERFFREARAAAALDHINIVRAHDVRQEAGLHFLVLEYVEGKTLQEVVEKEGSLSPDRAAGYILQAAHGLQHAHERGLVHRDIKPSNLLVDATGTVKILDMGLARFFQDTNDNITRNLDSSAILGTADYIAPEQALNSQKVDIRADIYSLGATLYALLSGKPPFNAATTTTQKLLAHQLKQALPLSDVRKGIPSGLSQIVSKMMAKDPDERFKTPKEVIAALEPWARAESVPPKTAELPKPPVKSGKRRFWPVGLAAGLAATVFAAGTTWWLVAAATTPSTPPAETHAQATHVEPPQAKAPEVVGLIRPLDHASKDSYTSLAMAPGSETTWGLNDFGQLIRWNHATGKVQQTVPIGAMARAALVAGDGGKAVILQLNTPVVIDLSTGKEVGRFLGHKASVWSGAVSPNGKQVLTAGDDAAAILWDIDTRKEVVKLVGEPGRFNCAAFSPDGQWIAVGGADTDQRESAYAVRIWNAATGKEILQGLGHTKDVRALAFSQDGRQLASGGVDGSIRLWAIPDGLANGASQVQPVKTITNAHKGTVVGLGYQTTGRRWLSFGGSDAGGSALKFWSAEDGQALAAWEGPRGEASALAVSADGRTAVTATHGHPVQLWGLPDEKAPVPTPVVNGAGNPPPATVGNSQRIFLFDPAEWPEVKTRKKGSEVITEVGGPWAEPWRSNTWDKATIAEFAVERVPDGKALSLCNIQGRASAQITVAKPLTTLKKGHRYQVAVVYQVDEGAVGSVHVRREGTHAGNVHMMDLRSTFGQWREAALVFTQAADAPLLLFLQNYSVGADKRILFRRIEITELPIPTDDRTVLHRMNLGQPFQIRKQGDKTLQKAGTGNWPAGWVGSLWKETAVGVFTLEQTGDGPVLSLEAVEGEPSMQLFTPSAPVQLKGGRSYAVKITYMGQPNIRANLGLREEEGTTDRVALQLLPTGDEWRTTEIVFQPPKDCPLKLYIQHRTTNPDSKLFVRSMEVSEVK